MLNLVPKCYSRPAWYLWCWAEITSSVCLYVTISCFVGLERRDFRLSVQGSIELVFWVPSNAGCPQENGLNACRKQRSNRRQKIVDVLLNLFRFVMFLRFIWWFHFCWVFAFWHLYLRCWFQPVYKRRTSKDSPVNITHHDWQWSCQLLVCCFILPGRYVLPYYITHWDPYCWWFRNPANTPVPVSQFVDNLL